MKILGLRRENFFPILKTFLYILKTKLKSFFVSSRWSQKCVAVIFLTLVTLWVTRDMFGGGWGFFFKAK
jgi:hypothetical protein